jgi:DNA polymerase-3 subunit delta'
MGLNEFIGNTAVLDVIKRQLVQDRLPHSMLFVGIRGIGKHTLAGFVSMVANCQKEANDFCRDCPSCRKILQNSHADVKLYGPEGQFIKIDQMRELSREVFFRPFEGKMRVFIIDEAEKMNLESANSILKTLEEPPESSLLILISDKPNELLGTIRSRCQIFRFAPLSPDDIDQILRRQTRHLAADREFLSRISKGSVGRALNIDLARYRETRQELLDLIKVCCSQEFLYTNAALTLASLARERDEFENKMEILYCLLHDLFLLKVDAVCEFLTNTDVRGTLSDLAPSLSFQQIQDAIKALDHLEAGSKRNLNKQLALDHFVFQLSGQLAR